MDRGKVGAEKKRGFVIFSVASVLFGWHSGGGFATGNQANQYFVVSGWLGPLSALGALLLLTLTVRQAMIMYNERHLSGYKELFETLYHPFDRLELLFEIYYYIMVLMVISSCTAGAGVLLTDAFGIPYLAAILGIGALLLVLTMFGAGLVRRIASILGSVIFVFAMVIFLLAISRRAEAVAAAAVRTQINILPQAVLKSFQYAGFQCACIPTMIACGTVLLDKGECKRAMWLSFVMNGTALCLSVFMLLGWREIYTTVEGGMAIPTLTVCREMGLEGLVWVYYICLFLCFISSGSNALFGVTSRLAHLAPVRQRIKTETARMALTAAAAMAAAMGISLAGLTNIIRYGYGYCGYIGIAAVVLPFLTLGVYKNRKYAREHGQNKANRL